MITFNIWGNCMSRDILTKIEEKQFGKVLQFVGGLVAHPISAFSDKYERTITMDSLSKYEGNKFQKRCFCQDMNKTALEYLTAKKSDYLIVDWFAISNNLYKKNGHYMVANSLYLKNKEEITNDFALTTDYELINPYNIDIEVWRRYMENFCGYISRYYTPNQIILIECFGVTDYYDFNDNEHPIKAFDDFMVNNVNKFNSLVKELNTIFLENIRGCHVINFCDGITADNAHQWGLHPFHYESSYYDYAARAVEAVCRLGNDDKKEQEVLSELRHFYTEKIKLIREKTERNCNVLYNEPINSLKQVGANPQMSFRDIRTIRLINRIVSMGGNIVDYLKDRNINEINLYGDSELIAWIYEQVMLSGILVRHCFSAKEAEYNVSLIETHIKIDARNVLSTVKIKTETNIVDDGLFVVVLNQPDFKFKRCVGLSSLITYSSIMRRLFYPVIEYRKKHAPKLKIVVVKQPWINDIKNKNEYESKLLNGEETEDPYIADGYSEEYIKDVKYGFPSYYKGEMPMLVDHTSKYLNIVNGHRVTTDIPDNARHTVFAFGASYTWGFGTDDAHTVPSLLQKDINEYFGNESPYRLLNCYCGGGRNYLGMQRAFLGHEPKDGDIAILFYRHDDTYFLIKSMLTEAGMYFFDPQKEESLFDRPHNYGEHMFSDKLHPMPAANEWYEKTIFNYLVRKNILTEDVQTENLDKTQTVKLKDDSAPEELRKYLTFLKEREVGNRTIGAIVMNCNPFTLGHRYLIEYAASKCDILYIFAVEEDLSFFPFTDRIELIKKGTADLKNVTVLPSGNFIISRTTFPAYFEKEAVTENTKVDASSDIETFAKYIAPTLNITVRFAGEEPLDIVTRQYNAQMSMLLPKHGIRFEVIPRKEFDGKVISASRVRALLKEKDFDSIKELVPETTLNYLIEKFGG